MGRCADHGATERRIRQVPGLPPSFTLGPSDQGLVRVKVYEPLPLYDSTFQ